MPSRPPLPHGSHIRQRFLFSVFSYNNFTQFAEISGVNKVHPTTFLTSLRADRQVSAHPFFGYWFLYIPVLDRRLWNIIYVFNVDNSTLNCWKIEIHNCRTKSIWWNFISCLEFESIWPQLPDWNLRAKMFLAIFFGPLALSLWLSSKTMGLKRK